MRLPPVALLLLVGCFAEGRNQPLLHYGALVARGSSAEARESPQSAAGLHAAGYARVGWVYSRDAGDHLAEAKARALSAAAAQGGELVVFHDRSGGTSVTVYTTSLQAGPFQQTVHPGGPTSVTVEQARVVGEVFRKDPELARTQSLAHPTRFLERQQEKNEACRRHDRKRCAREPDPPVHATNAEDEAACLKGEGERCVQPAWAYYHGEGVAQDFARFTRLMLRGCELGSSRACGCAATGKNLDGFPPLPEARRAELLARAARLDAERCERGDMEGCRDGLPKAEYQTRTIAACKDGLIEFCRSAGEALIERTAAPDERAAGFAVLEQSCDDGDRYACQSLASFLSKSDDPADRGRARAAFIRECLMGDCSVIDQKPED
jgi:TPR repeat protein